MRERETERASSFNSAHSVFILLKPSVYSITPSFLCEKTKALDILRIPTQMKKNVWPYSLCGM